MPEHIVIIGKIDEEEAGPISISDTERPPASGDFPIRCETNKIIKDTLASQAVIRAELPTLDALSAKAKLGKEVIAEENSPPIDSQVRIKKLSDEDIKEIERQLNLLAPKNSTFFKTLIEWYCQEVNNLSWKGKVAAITGFGATGFMTTAAVLLLLQGEPVKEDVKPVDNVTKAVPSASAKIRSVNIESPQIKTLTLSPENSQKMKNFYDQALKDRTISEADIKEISGLFPQPKQFPFSEKMTSNTKQNSNFLFLNGPTGGINNLTPSFSWISVNSVGIGLAKAYRSTQIIVAKVSDNKTIKLEDIILKIGRNDYKTAAQLSEAEKQRVSITLVNGIAVIVLLDYAHGEKAADNAVTLYVNKDQVNIAEMSKAGLSKLPMFDLAFTGDSKK